MKLVRSLRTLGLAAIAAAATSGTAIAQEVTLRLHHFLPAASHAHRNWIDPWAKKVEADSNGRISVQVFPSMQLGGRPPQLFDQARDGVVDIVWTLAGNTPGRFPKLEAFELPFIPHAKGGVTSPAVHEFYETMASEELQEVKVLAVFAHGSGHFFTKDRAVVSPADVKGMSIRVPNRTINTTLQNLQANPQGIPAPGVPEALAKGVVQGVVFPYEVVPALKVDELTNRVGEFQGDRSLYTAVFLFVMNKAKYDGLPDDLKKVIDDNAGQDLARDLGRMWDEWDIEGKEAVLKRNTPIEKIEGENLEAWKRETEGLVAQWAAERTSAGDKGDELVSKARELIEKHSQATN